MKKALLFLPILAFAAPAFAGPNCKDMEKKVPMWEIAKSFEEAGGEIVTMKTDDGCPEIYGYQNDKKVEIYYSPTDGSELEREED